MKQYRAEKTLHIATGMRIGLSFAQYEPREANVVLLNPEDNYLNVEATVPLTFKAREEIYLPDQTAGQFTEDVIRPKAEPAITLR